MKSEAEVRAKVRAMMENAPQPDKTSATCSTAAVTILLWVLDAPVQSKTQADALWDHFHSETRH